MDSDAVITEARSSIHLLKLFFLRLPSSYRVTEKSDPIAHFSRPEFNAENHGFYQLSQHSVLPSTCTSHLSHVRGGLHPSPFPPARITLLLLRYWLPRTELCCFAAKSDRCDSTARCSDGLRCCNHGSTKFNTFAETFCSPFAELVPRCGEIQPDRLPRAKLCCFSANSDRCDSRTRRSNWPRP